jgi:hypothetical protein
MIKNKNLINVKKRIRYMIGPIKLSIHCFNNKNAKKNNLMINKNST